MLQRRRRTPVIVASLALGAALGASSALGQAEEAASDAVGNDPATAVESVDVDGLGSGDTVTGRVIQLEAAGHRFLQDGEIVTDIAVQPGETVTLRVDNVEGVTHNIWIGTESELTDRPNLVEVLEHVEAEKAAGRDPGPVSLYPETDIGIADWVQGMEEFTWVVPDDVTDLMFACTVPGHYQRMKGTISAAS